MARVDAATRRTPLQLAQGFNPFERVFRLLTSVRFALGLIAALALSSLLGVVFPQMPDFVRESAGLREQWLAEESGRYGTFTPLLDRLQFFEVFHSYWFTAGLVLLLVSISVCTFNRFPPIWRSIRRPQKRVSDGFFGHAHHRAEFASRVEPDALVRVLRRQRYKVEASERNGATYLYGDRFGWAQLGTFASHLALLVFLAGGLLTWRMGFKQDLLVPEGMTGSVRSVASKDHMQVKVLDFVRRTDGQGNDLEYRTDLAIYRHGKEVARGSSTVNGPFEYDGYMFHQSTFTEDGAPLTIRDPNGRVVFDEVLNLAGRLPAPLVQIEDPDGNVVYRDYVAPTQFPSENSSAALVTLPDGQRSFLLATRMDDPNEMTADGPPFTLGVLAEGGEFQALRFGESKDISGYHITFASMGASRYYTLDDLLGKGQTMVEAVTHDNGKTSLMVVFSDQELVTLEPNAPVAANGETFVFGGMRALTGLTVRKDPGANFIWVATGLMLVGLGMTFYLPRRRLWAKITGDRTYLAGTTDRNARFRDELRRIGVQAGADERQDAQRR